MSEAAGAVAPDPYGGKPQLFTDPPQSRSDRITLQTAPNDRVVVRSGSSRIQVPTMDPADFPYLTASDLVPAFTLAGEDMADMIGPCLMAASMDATRAFLCGVHMHMVGGSGIDAGEDTPRRLAFAAANGNIFAAVRHDVEDGVAFTPFTLPTKAAAEVARLAKGPVRVEVSSRLVRFTFADGPVLISKLVEGTFPGYVEFTPGTDGATSIDAKLLSAAIGRLALADNGKDAYAYARLDIRDGVMVLDRETSDRASVYEEVPCATGVPVMFASVHHYLSTGLKALGGDRIDIVAHQANREGTQLIAMRRAGSDDAVFIAAPLKLRSMVPAKAGEE